MILINLPVLITQGIGGWSSKKHISTSTVNLYLQDINDNKPLFLRQDTHLSILEDTQPGSVLVTMSARDADGVSFYNKNLFFYSLSNNTNS